MAGDLQGLWDAAKSQDPIYFSKVRHLTFEEGCARDMKTQKL